MPDDDRTDTRTLGERPGTNDAPLGPSFRDGPPLQVFRAWGIGGDPELNHSEVCFPIRRRR